jgi:excisionase family DNA binding protein
MSNNKKFMDMTEVCDHIKLSKSTVYKLVHRKQIPFLKVRSKNLFDEEEINRWVLNGTQCDFDIPEIPMN